MSVFLKEVLVVALSNKLTKREVEVLSSVSLGHTAKELAKLLDISPRTVEGHICSIRLKLNAKNICHAVRRAFENRIIQTKL